MTMNAKVSHTLLSILLLTGCGFILSCSSEPVIQSDNAVAGQPKEKPKPLGDVIVASEDEIPTWDPSADETTLSSEDAKPDN